MIVYLFIYINITYLAQIVVYTFAKDFPRTYYFPGDSGEFHSQRLLEKLNFKDDDPNQLLF